MRLFVALPLPKETHAALAAWVSRCGAQPNLRWTPAEQLHITLHFLGEVAEERAPAITRALDGIEAAPVKVILDRIDVLGRANILVAAAKVNPALAALAEAVRTRMTGFTNGVAETFREFRPHVTLARARRDASVPKPKTLPAFAALEFRAECFRLYRSELSNTGAKHTIIREWPLG